MTNVSNILASSHVASFIDLHSRELHQSADGNRQDKCVDFSAGNFLAYSIILQIRSGHMPR